jgi:hypothetical protein
MAKWPAWRIERSRIDDQFYGNETMKKTILAALLGLACASAFAGVIHFDDLPGDGTAAIENGYAGFNWDNVGTVGEDAFPGSGYAAGTVSHANTAYNMNGSTAAVWRAGAFDFVGAWFTSAWLEQELAFDAYRDGQLVYSTDVSTVIDTMTPVWVGLGWTGIDTLVIYNSSGTQWAMDDLTVNVAADVPEPGSLALVGVALLGIGAGRRRKLT